MRLKVQRNRSLVAMEDRRWYAFKRLPCHPYCFQDIRFFQTWEQAMRYAMAMAYGD